MPAEIPPEVKKWVEAAKAGQTIGELAKTLEIPVKQAERIDQRYLRKGVVLPRLAGQREKPDNHAKEIAGWIRREIKG
jgi:hypothetical protein